MRRTAALVGLSVLAATSANAQRCRDCTAEDTVPRSHILPALGLRVGTPQKASVALGVVLGEDWQQNGKERSRNVALFAEPGLGAGRASLAFVDHGYGSFGSGYGIAATVLRTWKQPWQLGPDQTYVGGEAILWPILFVGPRVGILHRINGPDVASRRWFMTIDFGFGL
jgi:hypothetical protein